MNTDNKTYKVLFLCTGNSARSIFAEYLANHRGNNKLEAYSAGASPKGTVHPVNLEILKEIGMDASDARSKSLEEFKDQNFDFVITVCDKAREACPVFPGKPVVAHWGSPDPVEFKGTEDEKKRFFSQVAQQIARRIDLFASLPLESLDRLKLEAATHDIGQQSTTL